MLGGRSDGVGGGDPMGSVRCWQCPGREIAAHGGGMTPLQWRRDPTIRSSHRGSPRPGDGYLPSDAFWRAGRVRPRLAGFFERGFQRLLPPRALDFGDPPWRIFPVTTPAGRVGVRSPSTSLLGQSPNRQNRRRAQCDRRRALPRCLPKGRAMGASDRFGSRVRETATVRRTGTNRVGSLAGRARGGCSAIGIPGRGDNSGANGMERDVIADPGEMGGVLDQRGLGPTLQPRALLTVESSQRASRT